MTEKQNNKNYGKKCILAVLVKLENRKKNEERKIKRQKKGHEVLDPLTQDQKPLPESLLGSQVSPYKRAEKKPSKIRKSYEEFFDTYEIQKK